MVWTALASSLDRPPVQTAIVASLDRPPVWTALASSLDRLPVQTAIVASLDRLPVWTALPLASLDHWHCADLEPKLYDIFICSKTAPRSELLWLLV